MASVNGWKDPSELYLAGIRMGDPTLFKTVMDGKIKEARYRLWLRRKQSPDSKEEKLERLKALGIIRAVDIGPPVPIEELVTNVLGVGLPSAIYGARGSLKSLTSLALLIAVSSPEVREVLGYPVERHGPAILYDAEMTEHFFNNRTEAMCNGLGIEKPDDLYYMSSKVKLPKESWNDLHEGVEETGAVLVVVDSWPQATNAKPEDYNENRDATMEYIDPLLAMGCAVLMVEHKPHKGQHLFGSVSKEYFSRYIYRVNSLDEGNRRKGERHIELINEKASFAEEGARITLKTKFYRTDEGLDVIEIDPQGTPDIGGEEVAEPSRDARVLRSLREAPMDVQGLSEVTGFSTSWLHHRLPELEEEGKVIRERTPGRGGKLIWHDALLSDALLGGAPTNKASEPRVLPANGYPVLIKKLSEDSVSEVAIDLETMPPPGWEREVGRAYRKWIRSLKGYPKLERRRKKLSEIADKIYKRDATNTNIALPRLLSFATKDGMSGLLDAREGDISPVLEALKDKTLITHAGDFDLKVLRSQYGYVHRGRVHDTQVLNGIHHYNTAARTREFYGKNIIPAPEEERVDIYGDGTKVNMSSLQYAVHRHLGEQLSKEQQSSNWSLKRLSEEQLEYALADTTVLPRLVDKLRTSLSEMGMVEIVELESRAFPAIVDMSANGFPADRERAEEMAARYADEVSKAREAVLSAAPEVPEGRGPWNLNAAADVVRILELLGFKFTDKYPKTNGGARSTDKKALNTIKSPKAAKEWRERYQEFKSLSTLANTFASQYIKLIRPDGTISARYGKVATGRLSCSKPNLQQVPARGMEQGREGMMIRSVFCPIEGEAFVIADFSQVELLLAGTIAAKETGTHGHMLQIFREGEVDIHRATAASMMNKHPDEVTDTERTMAKAVNFGLIYGAKAEKLMESAKDSYGVEMSLTAAKRYRRAFFERYPEIADWHGLIEAQCRRGEAFAVTPMGRRRKLPTWINGDDPAHTVAKNMPVQGAGADALLLSMARMFEEREERPGRPRLVASVHDEVVLAVAEEHAQETAAWVKEVMADAEREAVLDPDSPIVVDVEVRDSWAK